MLTVAATEYNSNKWSMAEASLDRTIKQKLFHDSYIKCPHSFTIYHKKNKVGNKLIVSELEHPQEIPCGKCAYCLEQKALGWLYRFEIEMKEHLSTLFITLTYDNTKISSPPVDLDKRDMQLFFKRFRKKIKRPIRYYCIGEYGPDTGRPHYHLLLFGGQLSDYDDIYNCWSLGNISVYLAEPGQLGYIAKFHTNASRKVAGKSVKEFTLQSRRPGIGGNYRDRYSGSLPVIAKSLHGYTISLPRYLQRPREQDRTETLARQSRGATSVRKFITADGYVDRVINHEKTFKRKNKKTVL